MVLKTNSGAVCMRAAASKAPSLSSGSSNNSYRTPRASSSRVTLFARGMDRL